MAIYGKFPNLRISKWEDVAGSPAYHVDLYSVGLGGLIQTIYPRVDIRYFGRGRYLVRAKDELDAFVKVCAVRKEVEHE